MKKILYAFLIFQALLFSSNAFSQSGDIFLKVVAPGYSFDGGATNAGYQRQIEVYSFSDGIIGCTVSGVKACVSAYGDFNFMTKMTRAVIDFMSVQVQNKPVTSADLSWVVSGEVPFVSYKVHMEDVKVLSVQESGSSGGDNAPTVSVSLRPSRIAWSVNTQNANGTPGTPSVFGWDFAKNIAFNYVFPQ